MRTYQFLFYTPAGASVALDFSGCDDDKAATREAFSQLGHHGSCRSVEVFEDDRLVIRLERGRGPAALNRSLDHGMA